MSDAVGTEAGGEGALSTRDEGITASAFVLGLRALADERRDQELLTRVDAAFAHRLPSGADLGDTLRAIPPGCTLILDEGPGYTTVAIPPPMVDDTDEEAARIDAIIAELQASTEVEGSCAGTVAEGHEAPPLFTIAVRRTPDGWRALAWRDHQAEGRHGRD